jgi:transposase
LKEFEQICRLADGQEPQPIQKGRGKPKNTKGRNLLNRLTSHRDAWLSFAFVPDVPFTNNQAERDIRHLKIKQKVATNFQTFKGAQHYARIQSFSSTLRKHSMNVFQNFIKILDGEKISFQVG